MCVFGARVQRRLEKIADTAETRSGKWKRCELGHALTLQRGFDLPNRLRREGEIPIISSSGISGMHDRAQVQAPGIVTGRYGTIGDVFYVTEDFWPLNTTLFVRDVKGNDTLYLSYLLCTVNLESYSGKSGVPGINRNDIHKLPIALPSLSEQRVIAEALSDVDRLLDAMESLIAKKRAIRQAAILQLLTGKIRLRGFSHEWETNRLGDIASFFRGSSLSKTDLSPGGRQRCIHYGELFTTYRERITQVLHGTDRVDVFFYSDYNDVLMPTSDVTPNGLATASCLLIPDIIIGGDIVVTRLPASVLIGEFLLPRLTLLNHIVLK